MRKALPWIELRMVKMLSGRPVCSYAPMQCQLSKSQRVSAKTMEVDSLRFGDSDLEVVGTLEVGQFGVVE